MKSPVVSVEKQRGKFSHAGLQISLSEEIGYENCFSSHRIISMCQRQTQFRWRSENASVEILKTGGEITENPAPVVAYGRFAETAICDPRLE